MRQICFLVKHLKTRRFWAWRADPWPGWPLYPTGYSAHSPCVATPHFFGPSDAPSWDEQACCHYTFHDVSITSRI